MADEEEETRGAAHAKSEVSRTPVKVSRGVGPIAPAALLVALIAVGLAIWALMKAPSEAPAATQVAGGDPKTVVCDAFKTVATGVQLQTHEDLGPDPIAVTAVAGNARLALLGGGQYLMDHIHPDAPSDLADAARAFATNLQDIGMNALAGIPNSDPVQAERLKQGEGNRTKIAGLCQ